MMGFFSNLFAKQNCAVCGKECGTLHRSKLRDGQFLSMQMSHEFGSAASGQSAYSCTSYS